MEESKEESKEDLPLLTETKEVELPPPPPKKVLPRLKEVIEQTKADSPFVSSKIENEDSNFVVVTYWWGRGNLNNNTARPCVSYYEDLFKRIEKVCVDTMLTINQMAKKPARSELEGQVEEIKADLEGQLENITKIPPLYNLLKKKTNRK